MPPKAPEKRCRVARQLRHFLWFIRRPCIGSLILYVSSWLVPLIGYIPDYTTRVVLAWLAAAIVVVLAYVPFLTLLYGVVRDIYKCATIPAAYLLYIFFALQLAHTNVSYAVYVGDEPRSYSGVCGALEADPLDCIVQIRPWWIYTRFYYYAAVTFVSVGYGDITPQTWLSTLVAFPLLWTLIFFLGILLGKIVGSADGTSRNLASFS